MRKIGNPQKSTYRNQRVSLHKGDHSAENEAIFAGSAVPVPEAAVEGSLDVKGLQAALEEMFSDGRWLRLLEVLGATGVADGVQLREGTGLTRDQVDWLLRRMGELNGRIVKPLAVRVRRPGERGRPPEMYGLGEAGAALLRAAGHEGVRPCGLADERAVAHARAVLDVRLAAQAAGLPVWTEREYPPEGAGEENMPTLRPDNVVVLRDGVRAFFEVEQEARLTYLRRIVEGLRRRAAFFRSTGAAGVSPTVRVLFAVGEGKEWERTVEIWEKATALVA